MKRPITIVAEGMIHQIRDYGPKEPTLLLYQNAYHTIINYTTLKGYSYYMKILDDYLSDAKNRAQNKDICSGYFRFL